MREGACIGGATMPQPWTLRLTRNAAALAAASPTLLFRLCDFVTVEFVVTESSTGPRKRFREMIVAHVGVHGWVSPGSLLSGTLVSYGAPAVARTSDRGRVSKV